MPTNITLTLHIIGSVSSEKTITITITMETSSKKASILTSLTNDSEDSDLSCPETHIVLFSNMSLVSSIYLCSFIFY